MSGVIRDGAKFFLNKRKREQDILKPFLKAGFDVTWANRRTYSGTDVTVCLLRAAPSLKEAYLFEYEMVLIYSKYDTIEPRVLRAVDHIFSTDPVKGRAEPMWYFFVSEDAKASEWVYSYLSEHRESRIIVPFSTEELLENKSNEWTIRNQLQKYFYNLDRFKYTLPLKEDTYFFGRNEEVNELLNFTKRSENAGIFGLRKTGKTSILYKLKRQIEKDKRFYIHIIDAQSPSIRKRSWNDLLKYIINALFKTKSLENNFDFNVLDAADNFYDSLIYFFEKTEYEKLTIAFDEIEWITPRTSKDLHWNEEFMEFWQAIRTTQTNLKNFNIIIAGVNPSLVENSRFGDYQNPLFGIVTPIFLCGLRQNEVEEMILKVGKLMGLNFSTESIKYFYDQYAGHPLLTRLACSHVSEMAKLENKKFPLKIHKGELEKQKAIRDHELIFYVRHVVDELERFYPSEYKLLEQLALGDFQGFKDIAVQNEFSAHLFRYCIVINPDYPYIAYDILREYVAIENARREGRPWKMKLVKKEDRNKFIRTRMRSIIDDIRDLEKYIKKNKLPLLFGPNSFPEAERLFDIDIPHDKESLGSALNILNRCFVESIENYGNSISDKKYFWSKIKNYYPDLQNALLRIKIYRHNYHHLELTPSVEDTLRSFLEKDLDDALASSNEKYWGLFQRTLDELFLGIQREISKLEE